MSTESSGESAVETLASYVPALVVDEARRDPVPPSRPESRPIQAAVLFADVSGFTRRTARATREGPAEVEALTRSLSQVFGGMIDDVTAHGGDIEKIIGDAILAFWLAGPDTPISEATQRAVQCAAVLQEHIDGQDLGDGTPVRMRIAVVAGDMQRVHVGGEGGRWEFLLTGGPLLDITRTSKQAQPGETVVAADAVRLAREGLRGRPLPSGDEVLLSVETRYTPRPRTRPSVDASMEGALRAFVPGSLADRVAAGQRGWLAELRQVTVLFIHLTGLETTRAEQLAEVQKAMVVMQRALHRYGGVARQLTMNDKGPVLMAVFGLPLLAHEDDPVRAVLAARELHAELGRLWIDCTCGVATGSAYCGTVGSETRREYAVVGDAVNLAARFMEAKEFRVVCDARTAEAAAQRITFEELPELSVKGWRRPIPVFRPRTEHRRQAPGASTFVGRASERASLDGFLEQLQKDGQGRVVAIEGEPGIGKSHLVRALADDAARRGIPVWEVDADSIDTTTPYLAWRPLLQSLVPLPVGGDAADNLSVLREELAADPELVRLAPLLSDVLGIDLAQPPEIEVLRGEERAESTRRLLLGLLAAPVREKPSLILGEDLHWMDSASVALLQAVARSGWPTLLVATTRPLGEGAPPETAALLEGSETTWFRLEGIGAENLEGLVAATLGVDAVPSSLLGIVQERSGGHPYFAEELSRALLEAGVVEVEAGRCRLRAGTDHWDDVPDTLEKVVTSRVDRLAANLQLTLKVASVVGRVFAFRTLSDVHPIEEVRESLPDEVSTLARIDLTPLVAPPPELAYGFKHAITHDVVYGLLPFAERRALHGGVACWYEANPFSTPNDALMAHHWTRADEPARALGHLEQGGASALRQGAYREAVGMLGQALLLLEQPGIERTAAERAHLQLQLGEALVFAGDLEAAEPHLTDAMALLGDPWPASPGAVFRALARETLRQVWIRWLPRRGPAADLVTEATRWHARALQQLGSVLYFRGRSTENVLANLRQLNHVEKLGPSAELASARIQLGVVFHVVGLQRLAERYVALAREALPEDAPVTVRVELDEYTAVFALGMGRWEDARSVLERSRREWPSLATRARVGNTSLLAILAFHQGQVEEAEHWRRELRELVGDRDLPQALCWWAGEQAELDLLQGRVDDAIVRLREAEPILDRLSSGERGWIQGLAARAHLMRGDLAAAEATALEALAELGATPPTLFYVFEGAAAVLDVFVACGDRRRAEAQQTARVLRAFMRSFPVCRPRVQLALGAWANAQGRKRVALRCWRGALANALELGMPHAAALAQIELATQGLLEDPERVQALGEARERLVALGAAADLARLDALEAG